MTTPGTDMISCTILLYGSALPYRTNVSWIEGEIQPLAAEPAGGPSQHHPPQT